LIDLTLTPMHKVGVVLCLLALTGFPIKSVGQQLLSKELQYVDSLNSYDTLCISNVAKAKKNIEEGKLYFIHSAGFLYGRLRSEDELKKICKNLKLTYEIQLISDFVYEGQTDGCMGITWTRH
jgi:hypothetical protein